MTPTVTRTPTITATPTFTRVPTPTAPPEPFINFFGVARSDDSLVPSSGTTADGVPIFERDSHGFYLVVEARPGGTNTPIGNSTYDWSPTDPTILPNLLIEASRPLGDGSPEVCDDASPTFGGVPAVNPPDFSMTQAVADAINDFACRFRDGRGGTAGRGPSDSCIFFDDSASYHFVFPPVPGVKHPSTIQFCGLIDTPSAFPVGDTLVTVRISDQNGNISAPASLIIRVSP